MIVREREDVGRLLLGAPVRARTFADPALAAIARVIESFRRWGLEPSDEDLAAGVELVVGPLVARAAVGHTLETLRREASLAPSRTG